MKSLIRLTSFSLGLIVLALMHVTSVEAASTTIGLTIIDAGSGNNNTGNNNTGGNNTGNNLTGLNNTGGNTTGVIINTGSLGYGGGSYNNGTSISPIGSANVLTGWQNNSGSNSTGTVSTIDSELISAYERAFKNNITTMPTQEKARLFDPLTRAELAKMIVQFSVNVMGRSILPRDLCQIELYNDYDKMDTEQKRYIKLACDADIMGLKNDKSGMITNFRPQDLVTRAELAAVLSRFLYGTKNDGDTGENTRYIKHIQALYDAKYIIKIDTPMMKELRGYVLIILQRISTSSGK